MSTKDTRNATNGVVVVEVEVEIGCLLIHSLGKPGKTTGARTAQPTRVLQDIKWATDALKMERTTTETGTPLTLDQIGEVTIVSPTMQATRALGGIVKLPKTNVLATTDVAPTAIDPLKAKPTVIGIDPHRRDLVLRIPLLTSPKTVEVFAADLHIASTYTLLIIPERC